MQNRRVRLRKSGSFYVNNFQKILNSDPAAIEGQIFGVLGDFYLLIDTLW